VAPSETVMNGREMIFGPNLAGLYGVDIDQARQAFPDDAFAHLKLAYEQSGPEPSNTSYGWVTAS
jgi:hypothetical protein